MLDTSPTDKPFCKICTRGPSSPRITGLEAPDPNPVAETPSSLASVAPRDPANLFCNSSPDSTLFGDSIPESLSRTPLTFNCGKESA